MKNQVNALAVLSVGEIEQVSGAGTFLGDAIINGVYAANSFLNSPLFSSIGNAASAIGLNRTHEAGRPAGLPGAFGGGDHRRQDSRRDRQPQCSVALQQGKRRRALQLIATC